VRRRVIFLFFVIPISLYKSAPLAALWRPSSLARTLRSASLASRVPLLQVATSSLPHIFPPPPQLCGAGTTRTSSASVHSPAYLYIQRPHPLLVVTFLNKSNLQINFMTKHFVVVLLLGVLQVFFCCPLAPSFPRYNADVFYGWTAGLTSSAANSPAFLRILSDCSSLLSAYSIFAIQGSNESLASSTGRNYPSFGHSFYLNDCKGVSSWLAVSNM
jgi:hypothetical protein